MPFKSPLRRLRILKSRFFAPLNQRFYLQIFDCSGKVLDSVMCFRSGLARAHSYYVKNKRDYMAKREDIESKAAKMLEPIVKQFGVSIYDVEYVNEANEWYLRAYIDKDGGVTIDDCENVSRAMSDELDKDDFINEAYILEVSSPGLGRTLKKDSHLQKSIGEEVEIKTFKPINKKKEFAGTLLKFDKDTVTIEANGEETALNRSDIALIKLALDF